jgi:cell division septation protein DedD
VIAVRREEIEVPDSDGEATEDAAETGEEAVEGEAVDAEDAEAAVATGEAAEERPRRRNFFERIFGPRRSASASEISTGAEAATDGVEVPEVETQTLDPVASTTAAAAAAISRAEASDKPVARPSREEDAAAAPSIEEPAAEESSEPAVNEPAATPQAQELRNPFIQVGLYTVEANANSAAEQLRQAGIVPTVLKGERDDGESFWRVVVGPVTTADDQAALLGQVRAAGYGDAFLAPN